MGFGVHGSEALEPVAFEPEVVLPAEATGWLGRDGPDCRPARLLPLGAPRLPCRIEASRAAVVATLEPVVAAALAYQLFGERFTPLGYAGSALILAAVLTTILAERR